MCFPLVAKDGGVLMRSGHTEACIDLCRLAGLPPVGVLSELMNDDGTVMRGPGVAAFAQRHKLTQISIADLISYRQAREKLVKRVGEFPVKSEIGTLTGYAYVTPFDAVHHMAVVHGKIGDGKNVLARLHRADIIRDVFGGANPVHAALQRLKEEGRGVIVILRDGAAGVPTQAIPSGDQNSEAARTKQWREVGLGAQILKDLGISSIRLLTSAKLTYVGLAGFGIEITDTETPTARARAFSSPRVAVPPLPWTSARGGVACGGVSRSLPSSRLPPLPRSRAWLCRAQQSADAGATRRRGADPGRCRGGARGRRLLLDGPRRAGAAARRLYGGADLARIPAWR